MQKVENNTHTVGLRNNRQRWIDLNMLYIEETLFFIVIALIVAIHWNTAICESDTLKNLFLTAGFQLYWESKQMYLFNLG